MYFAVGFHCGNIHAYNIDHKVSFSTSISKTNILSLASSLKVNDAIVIWEFSIEHTHNLL